MQYSISLEGLRRAEADDQVLHEVQALRARLAALQSEHMALMTEAALASQRAETAEAALAETDERLAEAEEERAMLEQKMARCLAEATAAASERVKAAEAEVAHMRAEVEEARRIADMAAAAAAATPSGSVASATPMPRVSSGSMAQAIPIAGPAASASQAAPGKAQPPSPTAEARCAALEQELEAMRARLQMFMDAAEASCDEEVKRLLEGGASGGEVGDKERRLHSVHALLSTVKTTRVLHCHNEPGAPSAQRVRLLQAQMEHLLMSALEGGSSLQHAMAGAEAAYEEAAQSGAAAAVGPPEDAVPVNATAPEAEAASASAPRRWQLDFPDPATEFEGLYSLEGDEGEGHHGHGGEEDHHPYLDGPASAGHLDDPYHHDGASAAPVLRMEPAGPSEAAGLHGGGGFGHHDSGTHGPGGAGAPGPSSGGGPPPMLKSKSQWKYDDPLAGLEAYMGGSGPWGGIATGTTNTAACSSGGSSSVIAGSDHHQELLGQGCGSASWSWDLGAPGSPSARPSD